jgi:CRP-like cAMP-binding protein/CheY-like chemotaxis protein
MSAFATTSPRILVVEDNYLVAREVCEIVRGCGFSVAGPVGQVERGVELLGEQSVSGAIVDIRLGSAESFPICRELRRRRVPFVFLTACEASIIPPPFRQMPVLAKPVQAEDIKAALGTFVLPTPHRPSDPEANLLLAAAEAEDRALLAEHLEPVSLAEGQVLEEPGETVSHVWFPTSGLVAVVAEANGKQGDVALIGHEGLVGIAAMLDAGRAAHRTVVRFPGEAWRMPARALLPLLVGSRRLHGHLLRYGHSFMAELAADVLAAGQALIQQRVARWLLMVADRLHTEEVRVTHEMLAAALGVRRSGVTVALHCLEGLRAVQSQRSLIRIVDRARLVEETAGFYPTPFQAARKRRS